MQKLSMNNKLNSCFNMQIFIFVHKFIVLLKRGFSFQKHKFVSQQDTHWIVWKIEKLNKFALIRYTIYILEIPNFKILINRLLMKTNWGKHNNWWVHLFNIDSVFTCNPGKVNDNF